MTDLRKNIEMIHGSTEKSWELTTALPTDELQGVIIVQVPAGTDRDTIARLHDTVRTLCEGILGE